MKKLYFADAYFYDCPTCRKPNVGKKYFAVFQKAEIGAAKSSGLFTYRCSHCKENHSSRSVLMRGEVVEVTEEEARASGIDFESKG
jgi:hypothetical protein